MASSSNAASSTSHAANSKVASGWLAAQSTFVAIAALLVFVRIYVRSIIIKKVGLDDILIVIALVYDPTQHKGSAILIVCRSSLSSSV